MWARRPTSKAAWSPRAPALPSALKSWFAIWSTSMGDLAVWWLRGGESIEGTTAVDVYTGAMTDSPKLVALRKSLAEAGEGASPEASKQLAHEAIAKILMAIES